MKPQLRIILLVLAMTGATALAGCHITFGSVDLDRIEHPRDWGGKYGGREPGGPGDR
jgi:hypothetical protein